jgi:hypothetical protein
MKIKRRKSFLMKRKFNLKLRRQKKRRWMEKNLMKRMKKMLRDLNAEVEQSKYPVPNGLSILLVPTPGEQHTFGLAMVAELFRKQGWEVVGGPYDLGDSPQVLVAQRSFDVVGFSLATFKN